MQDERGPAAPSPDATVTNPRRRAALRAAIRLGLGAGLAPALAFAQSDQASQRPQAGDWLVKVDDATLTPLGADDISLGAPQTMAWAIDPASRTVRNGSRLNRLLLLRLDPATLAESTRANAAAGIVAYTAICTHNGCDVTDWLSDEQALSCPCHQTRFDPKSDGRVIEGAAPRPLPALPLAVADGKLVVARGFTSRVGFEPA
jgi:rieske iron-sulfur protein